MTYSSGVPNASESPGVFPGQGQTNFGRLKTIIDADHKFNDTAAADDGFHERVSLINQASDPAIPAGADTLMYSQDVALGTGTTRAEVFGKNAAGFHLLGARAAVLFTVGAGPGFAITLVFAFNVSGVVRNGPADFTITFSRNMTTNRYVTLGMAQAKSGAVQTVHLPNGADYTTAQTVGAVNIITTNTSLANESASVGVFIFGG